MFVVYHPTANKAYREIDELDREHKLFCAEDFHTTAEAGGLHRTAQIQPGVFYTLEAPYIRIFVLYSNTLEDPGVISSEDGTWPDIGDSQLAYLKAALQRAKDAEPVHHRGRRRTRHRQTVRKGQPPLRVPVNLDTGTGGDQVTLKAMTTRTMAISGSS